MAWEYDASLSTDKDYVRFLIGDTDDRRKLVEDETIEAVLENEPNKFMTAAAVIESLFRGLTAGGSIEDRKVGETRTRYQRVADLMKQVHSLRMRGAAHMKPSAGGIYDSETDTYNKDTSLDKAEIAKRMMDNPRATRSLTNSTS